MEIKAQDVNKLRQLTGAGMMDCKKALTEAEGDFEKAIDILRKKGQKISAARADRTASEGAIFIKTNEAKTEGVIISLNCETDFVAKNEDFVALGNKILDKVFETKPASIEEINGLSIEGKTVSELLTEIIGKIGEKIEVGAYETISGEKIVSYLHGTRVGVLVALKNVNGGSVEEAGKDVAMQIAAMKPVAVDKDDVAPTIIEREIEIGKEQARQEGKPEAMLEKIALGKLNKFYKDNTLLNQEFVKDNTKSIAQYLEGVQKGLTVSAFKRVAVGA
ncbi:translation elongation factor Ts [Thermoflexibacter ruber]|uniref:Elongation factor Ts n=1 Tax=Thermoflexibacter ruber TaxID=1003 RepID=A0A1I2E7W8_9BACT|nr:translation elongation factor Ts [Thermoflexibacter ruber]SFE88578.1 elongation factor Ts [Thermoflexibacter ruber]